jgi:hypothetical protein
MNASERLSLTVASPGRTAGGVILSTMLADENVVVCCPTYAVLPLYQKTLSADVPALTGCRRLYNLAQTNDGSNQCVADWGLDGSITTSVITYQNCGNRVYTPTTITAGTTGVTVTTYGAVFTSITVIEGYLITAQPIQLNYRAADVNATTSPTPDPSSTASGAPASSSTAPPQGSSGLSGGAIAGIVVGVVFAILLFILGILLWRRRLRQASLKHEAATRSGDSQQNKDSSHRGKPELAGSVPADDLLQHTNAGFARKAELGSTEESSQVVPLHVNEGRPWELYSSEREKPTEMDAEKRPEG